MMLLSLMQVFFGMGFIVGALLLSKKNILNKVMKALSESFILVSICFMLLGLVPLFDMLPSFILVGPVFIIGFSIVRASIHWQTYLQSHTPESTLGRVSAIASLAGDVTMPIAYLVYGYLLDVFSFSYVTLLSGGILLLMVILNGLYCHHKKELSTYIYET